MQTAASDETRTKGVYPMAVYSNPFNELLRLQRDLDSYLRNPMAGFFSGPSAAGVFPPVNVFRDKSSNLIVRAELPGVKPEDVSVTVEDRRLTISGEREAEGNGEGSFHRRERPVGRFARSIELPADLDVGKAEAKFNQGVLSLRIPRAEAAKPRQITIQAA